MSSELIAVVVGGSIALATAALGYGFAWFQYKSKRAFDLRQTVYLEAAAAMAEGLKFFPGVAGLDMEDEELASLVHPTSVAMYKIHVVGTPPTISALSKANEVLTVSAIDLSRRRVSLRSATAEAARTNAVEAHRKAQSAQKELFVAAMQASLRYQRELVEVNILARRELGLPLDEAEYRAMAREAEQRISSAIEGALGESG